MKNDKDFLKINGGEHGAINFNNMIPVHNDALIGYDINNEPDIRYQNILKAQVRFLRINKDLIMSIFGDIFLQFEINERYPKPLVNVTPEELSLITDKDFLFSNWKH